MFGDHRTPNPPGIEPARLESKDSILGTGASQERALAACKTPPTLRPGRADWAYIQSCEQCDATPRRAGILRQVNVGRRNRAYEAPDIIVAFTAMGRQLASPTSDSVVCAGRRAAFTAPRGTWTVKTPRLAPCLLRVRAAARAHRVAHCRRLKNCLKRGRLSGQPRGGPPAPKVGPLLPSWPKWTSAEGRQPRA